MKGKLVLLLAGGMLMSALTVYAHHSFAATYFENKQVKIEGKITQFLFRNPHSFVHVQAPDENGVMQNWMIEWGGAGQLGGQGITRDTIKIGDPVIITDNPGRDASDHRIRMVSLKRTTDGFGWGGRAGETAPSRAAGIAGERLRGNGAAARSRTGRRNWGERLFP